jgi:hypothetical protein
MKEVREQFRYLENPKNSLIIVTKDIINDKELSESLYLFRSKNTKFILVNDEKLRKVLSLENDKIYQYYPAKLPFKMKDTDNYLKEHFAKLTGDSNPNVHEILSREGMDLNSYLNTNSTSLMIKFNLFRDEIKLSKDLIKSENLERKNFSLKKKKQ